MKTGSDFLIAAVIALSLVTGGCASITGTTNQSISVQTRDQAGKEAAGAACELANNKGKWFVTTPGSVTVTRSNDDMQVLCTHQLHEPGRASVVSATKGSMFGNIVFGGGIGAVIDHSSGAAYEYPSLVQVLMGTFTRTEGTQPAPAPTAALNSYAQNAPAQEAHSIPPTVAPKGETPREEQHRLPIRPMEPGGYSQALAQHVPPPRSVSIRETLVATQEDTCPTIVSGGEKCWWSPPGNYSVCPTMLTLSECERAYGKGCRMGHGRAMPGC